MRAKFILPFCLLLLLFGCRDAEQQQSAEPPLQSPKIDLVQLPREKGCKACHPVTGDDPNHAFLCVECHDGNPESGEKGNAHQGLVARPAHPDFMAEKCGECHVEQIRQSRQSLHFTLHNAVNMVRTHFGADDRIDTLLNIPETEKPSTRLALADDMLRRRCLRCHVYSPGDDYPLTRRGTGCAACHLDFTDGRPESHELVRYPSDYQCLGCHYGNSVGADYYGRYEHDFNWEYRTPFITRQRFIRPYGVEYHDLAPDIHQQRGLVCIDCHSEHSTKKAARLTCRSCHRGAGEPVRDLPANVAYIKDNLVLTSRVSGERHTVPQLEDPAHEQYGNLVACQVCHARWAFNDSTTHLLRSDSDDYYPWQKLTVQGSSEIEKLLEHNLYSDEEEYPPAMRDGITGETKTGLWYKGFTQRRWEDMIIRRDSDGIIKVFRPILDLRLSYVDSDGNPVFDNSTGRDDGLRPYTPHTTGPAGMFYLNRLASIMNGNSKPQPGQ